MMYMVAFLLSAFPVRHSYPLLEKRRKASCSYFFFLWLLSVGFFQAALSQKTVNNFRLYTVKDGLSSNYVTNLLLDSKGYLWVGTLEGISRFDGTSFNNLVTTSRDFTSKKIESINQLNDSVVLIGTASGLVVFNLNNNQFQNHRIRDSLLRPGSMQVVRSIVRLPNSRCLVAAGNYVFLLNKDLEVIRRRQVTTFYKHAYSIPHRPVFLDKDSTRILVMSPEIKEFNIATFKEGSVKGAFSRLSQLQASIINSLQNTSDSSLIYSTWDKGLRYFTKGINRHIAPTEFINPIRKIQQDPFNDRMFWMATGNGIAKFDEKSLGFSRMLLKGADDIKSTLNICSDLLFDKHNNLWIATEAGLVKMSGIRNAFKEFTLSFQPNVYGVVDATLDTKGELWLCSWGNNLLKVDGDGKVTKRFNERKDGTGHLSEKLFLAADTLYAATNTGTFYYHEKKQRFVSPDFYIPDSLKTGDDKLVYRDSHHNWWIGFYGRGLYRYNTTTKRSNFYTLFRPLSSPDYLEMLYPTSIAEDRWGNLWLGRANGSSTFTHWNRQTEKFTVIPFHLNGQTVRNFGINSIAIDGSDNVWMATTEYGVLQYNIRKDQWVQYDKSKGVNSLYVPGLVLDKDGNVWAGTYNGLSVLYRGRHHFISFSEEDGLPFSQIFWVGFPDRHRTDSLLIAGLNKLAWVSLPQLKRSEMVPAVSIQYLYINNEPFFDFSRHSFPHTQSSFRFMFTSVNLRNGHDNVFAYRLKGADKEWLEIGRTQEVSLNNLAAGRYVFEVKARSPEGIWSAPAAYAFTIQRPYYQQWWFYLLLACTIFGIGYSLYRYRVNKIKALYKIRSRISRDLHDEVGSTLSSISIMNEMARSKANGHASINEKIADNLQKVQNSMQDIVWAVNPKNDDLDHLLLRFSQVAQEMLEPKGIVYDFTAPTDLEGLKLSMEHRREIYLIYKEWLNNIVKYSGCTKVDVRLTLKGKLIHLSIADNGKGFDTSGAYPGNGLKNMQERAKTVKGSLFIYSEEQNGAILDLKVPLT